MKIGIIGDALDLQYAGIHYYVKNFVKVLPVEDSENEYFLFRCKSGSQGFFKGREVVVANHSWIPGYMFWRLFVVIPYYVRKFNLDAVIETAHFGPFNVPKKVKRLTVIHDLTPLKNSSWHTLRSWLLHKLFLKGVIRRADLIITNSEYTKSDIIKYYHKPADKVCPAYLGVSPSFRPVKDENRLGRLGVYKPYLLYVGTIEPRKNLKSLFTAFDTFKARVQNPDLQLLLVGKEGWKSREIMRARDQTVYSDDIIILGFVDREDLPVLMTGCELFIYPSLYEGFGMPVLEALACGARVLASNTTSIPEVGSDYAVYFDPENPADIADKMIGAYTEPGYNKETAIQYAQSFTWVRTAKRVITVFQKLKE